MSEQYNQTDYMGILNKVFNPNTPSKLVEDALVFIEQNFTKLPQLVQHIVDFYFNYDGSQHLINLLLKMPDELTIKLFDKLNESLRSNNIKLEKIMALLVTLSHRTKSKTWHQRLIQHALFTNLIRHLNAKSNTPNSTNEHLTIQTSLLFVSLMSTIPSQIVNNLPDLFQIVFNSFKSLTVSGEQVKKLFNDPPYSTLIWSIKLFFYVFYGLFPNQFIQYLRKKDNQNINKEALTSIFIFLRLHPLLAKEKIDTQIKLADPNDALFEWRQYCLDQKYTNFNQIMSTMQHISNLHQTPHRFMPQLSNQSQSSFGSNQSIVTPLSPSYQQFTSSSTKSIQETLNMSASSRNSNTKTSVPSTPTPETSGIGSVTTSNMRHVFQFPSIESLDQMRETPMDEWTKFADSKTNFNFDNSTTNSFETSSQLIDNSSSYLSYGHLRLTANENANNKNPIQNLTARFMQQPDEQKQSVVQKPLDKKIELQEKRKFLLKNFSNAHPNTSRFSYIQVDNNSTADRHEHLMLRQKSFSETNLTDLLNNSESERRPKARTFLTDNQQTQQQPQLNSNRKLIKSEMRDTNILRPNEFMTNRQSFFGGDSTMCNKGNEEYPTLGDAADFPVVSKQTAEPNEILSNYLASYNDYPELYYELLYERSLREKYEELANRLYFSKVERDQLIYEKAHIEKSFRNTIEKHRKEMDDYLISNSRNELVTCKKEIEEKNKQIESYQSRQTDLEAQLKELKEKFDEFKASYKDLEKKYEKTEQSLEREQNINKHHQGEAHYIKLLRNTTDNLRRKLLLLTKMQNQETKSNTDITSHMYSDKEQGLSIFVNPLYKETINDLIKQQQQLQEEYNKQYTEVNSKNVKIEKLNKELEIKNNKIEELNQQLTNNVIDMNAELIRSHHRVYNSIVNINKRLEAEIIKLKSQICELKAQLEHQSQSGQQ